METLAYLHLALAYEAASIGASVPMSEKLGYCAELKRQKLIRHPGIPMLSLALTLAIFNMGSRASALQKEDTGFEVTQLQNSLIAAKYYKGPVTGYYGGLTESAVKGFQKAKGLNADGIAGLETLRALQKHLDSDSNQAVVFRISRYGLRQGDQGPEVKEVQQRLKSLGFNAGTTDTTFGWQTEKAVRQFQAARGLAVDGVVGKQTWFALVCLGSASTPYVVLVTAESTNTLSQVLQYVPNAYPEESSNGAYIHAGAFPNPAVAEERSKLLRLQGLNARVAYFR